MVNKIDQRLLDTNAMALGSGVGLAALEAMFNLVQTQSSLGAAMVKQHDTSHNAALFSLAQVLEAVLNGNTHCVSVPTRGLNKPVSVVRDQPASVSAPVGVTAPPLDEHMSELLDLLREHLSDIVQNSKTVLAVT